MMKTEDNWHSDGDDTRDTAEEHSIDSNQSLDKVGLGASLKLEVEEDYSPPSSPASSPPGPSKKQEMSVELQGVDEHMHEPCFKKKSKTTAGIFVTSSTNFDLQCDDEALEFYSEHTEEAQNGLSDDDEESEDDENIVKIKFDKDLEPVSGASLPYCCKKCDICFQDLSGLQEHKQIHLNEQSYRCPICDKEFFRAANLRMHKLIHSSDRPHKCPECDKGFIRTADVWRHLRNVHKIERSKVILGDNLIRNPWSIVNHNRCVDGEYGQSEKNGQKAQEEELKPYICTTCGKGFRKPNLLYKHKVIHRKDKPYKCLECGKAFVQLMRLKRHQQTHSGERPFYCEECGSTFTRLGSLQRHQRIHTGEKPYVCMYCDHAFTDSGTIRRHECMHMLEKS
uniref:Zinc finger protein 648 n=1 Tax=Geotrypetes seraphini TaxID=260995 RepID=A0A6P8NAE0_GEOSA|nr:zinc finger protein 648 [Geotrypetes seraphini]XP_033772674.1 zinc finger protein 648 [Geotrypetes seraphini]XP_033772675.1 zinc finger protein 648 [Geotrypetes seraphini]